MSRSSLASRLWLPLAAATLTLLAAGAFGCDEEKETTAEIAPRPLVESFSLTPERINAGEPVTIAWVVSNVTEITVASDDGSVGARFSGAQARMGSVEVIPRKAATYTLTARNNPGGLQRAAVVSATVQVVVNEAPNNNTNNNNVNNSNNASNNNIPAAPTVVLGVSPSSITEGATATLAWTVTDAETLELEANGAPVALPDPAALTGTLEVSPTSDTTWTMTATGAGGTASASASIEVVPVEVNPPPVIDTFTATPDQGLQGAPFTLAWTTTDATAVALTGPGGDSVDIDPDDVDGEIALAFEEAGTFTLTATGLDDQQVTAQVSVTLLPPLPAADITSFTASEESVLVGSEITLTFTAEHATGLTLLAGDEEVVLPEDINLDGDDITITLDQSTTFTLTATGEGGSDAETLIVETFEPVSIVSFTATPSSIRLLETTTLRWDTIGVTAVRLEYGDGSPVDHDVLATDDANFVQLPLRSVTFVLIATGPGGEARASVDVEVDTTATIELTADPETIRVGEMTTLSWVTVGVFNVRMEDDLGNVINIFDQATSAGSKVLAPTRTTTYRLFGPSGSDVEVEDFVTVTVLQPPVIDTFTATPAAAFPGDTISLAWTTTDATMVELTDPNGEPVDIDPSAVDGEASATLELAGDYTLTATGPGGVATQTASVTLVDGVSIVSFTAPEEPLLPESLVQLSWETLNATSVELAFSDETRTVATSGTEELLLFGTTTFTLTAFGPGGPVSATRTVTILDPTLPTIVSFTATPDTGGIDDMTTLAWEIVDADSISITAVDDLDSSSTLDVSEASVASDSTSVQPRRTTTWTLTASNEFGMVSATATFTVPLAILSFEAPDVTLRPGSDVTLSFRVQGAASASLVIGEGQTLPLSFGPDGNGTTLLSNLRDDLTATLIAEDVEGGTVEQTLSLDVLLPEIVTFAAADGEGALVEVSWTTLGVEQLTSLLTQISGEEPIPLELSGATLPDGSLLTEPPVVTTTYTLAALGGDETVTAQTTYLVPVAILSAVATPEPILYGRPAKVQLQTQGAVALSWRVGQGPDLPVIFERATQAGMLDLPTITATTTITFTATDPEGNTATRDVTLTPAAPTITSFAANPASLLTGQTSTLSWETVGAASITLQGLNSRGDTVTLDTSNASAGMGSLPALHSFTTVWTLTAINPEGMATASTTVTVTDEALPVNITSFTSSAAATGIETEITLSWTVENAASLQLQVFWGEEQVDSYDVPMGELAAGSTSYAIFEDTRFVLVATGSDNSTDTESLTVRALGSASELRLSELLYNPGGTDTNLEWVELYNSSPYAVDLGDVAVGYGGGSFAFSRAQLPSFIIEPGACVVIGGPDTAAANANPVYDVVFNFNPDIQNSGGRADGFALFTVPAGDIDTTTIPLDAVVYGATVQQGDLFPDPFGSLYESPDAPEVGSAQSIARRFRRNVEDFEEWIALAAPTPGRCFGFEDADPAAGFDVQVYEGRRSGPEVGGQLLGLSTFNANTSETLQVFFGAVEAECAVDSLGTLCIVPPGTGLVDLTLQSGDATLVYPAFYSYETIDYCNIQFPTELFAGPSESLPTVYGRVYEQGVTETPGDSGALVVEWGFGPFAADPLVSDGWTWLPATFNMQYENDDEYAISGALAPNLEDLYSYAFRVRQSSSVVWTYCDTNGTVNNDPQGTNFFDVDDAGILEVITPQ